MENRAKESFKQELDPKLHELLLQRMGVSSGLVDGKEEEIDYWFKWSGTPEGEDFWIHISSVGVVPKNFIRPAYLPVSKPWSNVDPAVIYTRILTERDGVLNFFEGEVEGQKDLIASNIFKQMSQNDALEYMRDEHGIHVFAMISGADWHAYTQILFSVGDEKYSAATVVIRDTPGNIVCFPGYLQAITAGIERACQLVNDRKRRVTALPAKDPISHDWESMRRMEKH